MWRQKRAENGQDTRTQFSLGCNSLPTVDADESSEGSPQNLTSES